MDGTIVNVALPAIQRDLGASAFEVQWVVEAYALFLASLVLVGGALGDRYGRRRVFAAGVLLFGLASLGCALSQGVTALVLSRALQGVGGALLVPGSLALISAAFPESERGQAIGTWSGFGGITAAVGPIVGGWLVDTYSWQWAFLINLPLCAAVLVIAWAHIPESRGANADSALDYPGALLATLGLGGLAFAFIEAPTRGWSSPLVSGALVLGVAVLAAFVVVERRSVAAMLPLALFRIRNFSGANLLTLLLYAALGGGLYFFPINLIQVHGYSATAAGAALLPFILIMFLLSRWSGKLVDRVGPRLPLVVGPMIAAAGFALFALPGSGGTGAGSYWTSFFPAVVVLGLGMTITVAPLTTTVMNSVGADLAGVASGVNNAVARTATLLAIPVFGMLLASAFGVGLNMRLAALQVSEEAASFLRAHADQLAGIELPASLDAATALVLKGAVGAAYVDGFRWVMGVSSLLALVSALAAWGMVRGAGKS